MTQKKSLPRIEKCACGGKAYVGGYPFRVHCGSKFELKTCWIGPERLTINGVIAIWNRVMRRAKC